MKSTNTKLDIGSVGIEHPREGTLMYEPKDDLTVLELSEIVMLIAVYEGRAAVYDMLPDNAKRHFVRVD